MNRKTLLWMGGIATVITISCLLFLIDRYLVFKRPDVKETTVFYLYPEQNYTALLDSLEAHDIFKHPGRFKRAADRRKLEKYLKPGRYVIDIQMNNQAIIRMFANGWETPQRLAFRGYIKTLDRLAAYLGKHFCADSTAFIKALTDSARQQELGMKPETMISIFIPNTYEMYWTSSPEDIIKRFKREYDRFWNEERLLKAKDLGLTPTQVITLASILVQETNYAPELPAMAAVYLNRLKKGIKLQACPTVIYAHRDVEPGITRVLKRHLQYDSPYNTYRYAGLPPGPITIPTIQAIDAVLNRDKNNYLYFCANSNFDGTHKFTASYQEHLRNAKAYQKALTAKQAASKTGSE